MTEFIINRYLALKLIEGKTYVYVNEEQFLHCKFLLLTIPIDEIKSFDEIESIDEAVNMLDKSLEPREGTEKKIIPPEVEFWGHCSNLQVWYEQDYDTRLLHSNLAFPLLKKLSEVGDPVARQRFKEEIIRRFTSGNENVQIFLYAEKYLSYLDEDMFLENVLNAEEANSMIELKLKSRLRYKFVINFNDDEVRKRIFLEPLYYSIKNGHIDELEIDLYQFNFSLPDLLLRFSKLRSLTIFSKSHLEKILEFNIELKTINTLTIKVEGNIKIPNLFQNFPNVSDLFINGDDIARFEEIPESIGQLEHLEWLEINFIPLKKIPNSFKKLKNLEWLTLNNANLEKIPDKNDFKNLETLYIDGFFL